MHPLATEPEHDGFGFVSLLLSMLVPLTPAGCPHIHCPDSSWVWSGDHTGQEAEPDLLPSSFLSSPGPFPLSSCHLLFTHVSPTWWLEGGFFDNLVELAEFQRTLPTFLFKRGEVVFLAKDLSVYIRRDRYHLGPWLLEQDCWG